jgi:3-isopropylmalate/(R)-2-methylmalate dehydratase small subunit
MRYEGRVWLFPANITTEDILPNQFLDRANEEVGQFAMAGVDPDFVKKIAPGDLIVGGANFGTGSSRETAPIALQLAGIGGVIAPSFGRVFLRNCINIGLPAVMVQSIDGIQQGDTLVIDLESRQVSNSRTDSALSIKNLTGISLDILQAGGIIPFTKQRKANQ